MTFWLIVAAAVTIVLALAWRMDRRRKVTITRRNGATETDIARGTTAVAIHRFDGGGSSNSAL